MNEYTHIKLVDQSKDQLLDELLKAEKASKFVIAWTGKSTFKAEEIRVIRDAITSGKLAEYINKNLHVKGKVLVPYGNTFRFVNDLHSFTSEGHLKKLRNPMTHLTPKKLKRK